MCGILEYENCRRGALRKNVKVPSGIVNMKNQNFTGIKFVPYEAPLVMATDKLLEYAKKNGSAECVTSEKDWETLEMIIRLWHTCYPEYAAQFFESMNLVRSHSNETGVAREGEAMIQRQLEIPEKLISMIRVIFPVQKWDKKFVYKFAKRFSGFAAADKI